MCPIRRSSLLVHVAYPQILGTNGLVVVVVQFYHFSDLILFVDLLRQASQPSSILIHRPRPFFAMVIASIHIYEVYEE